MFVCRFYLKDGHTWLCAKYQSDTVKLLGRPSKHMSFYHAAFYLKEKLYSYQQNALLLGSA